jgi:hypothetical protein
LRNQAACGIVGLQVNSWPNHATDLIRTIRRRSHLGPGPHCMVDAPPCLNLFVVLLGDSSKARNGTRWGIFERPSRNPPGIIKASDPSPLSWPRHLRPHQRGPRTTHAGRRSQLPHRANPRPLFHPLVDHGDARAGRKRGTGSRFRRDRGRKGGLIALLAFNFSAKRWKIIHACFRNFLHQTVQGDTPP